MQGTAAISLGRAFSDSELIIGLVGAVGTNLATAVDILRNRLQVLKYNVELVQISREIIPKVASVLLPAGTSEYHRISTLMDAGNEARERANDNSILALGAAAWIAAKREKDKSGPQPTPRRAYIIQSLKHPDEVLGLREIYSQGFYLLGVHADKERRLAYLREDKRMTLEEADALMRRDEDEHLKHGQRVTDTFYLSDFFVRLDGHEDRLKRSLWRILDILFGHPNRTPTLDEYAMFLAFAASLRSADLSRQVGAVIANDQEEIIATGANDCPRYGGGLYWPFFDSKTHDIEDKPRGRDYTRGEDANKIEQQKIIEDILAKAAKRGLDRQVLNEVLNESGIRDLTEFGRVVHAEMEALLSCARNHVSTRGGVLYCTTFPCHNCAKHIVAAGIKRVVYIEPYEKSKAGILQDDAIAINDPGKPEVVHFESFVGIGPRRFFDLFSTRLGSGYELKRKDEHGKARQWAPEHANLRLQMSPGSYLDLELMATNKFATFQTGDHANERKTD